MKRFPPGNDKGSPVGEFEPDFFSVVRTLTEMSYFDRRVLARRGGAAVTQDRFLYKYRAVDVSNKPSVLQLRDLIVLSKFWLSSVSDFNDPFDGSGNMIAEGTAGDKRTRIGKFFDLQGLSWSKKQKAIAKLATKPNSYFEAKVREYYRSYYARVGISCFAGDPRNVLMWSHYANKHTGIWLQFESARDPETFAHTVGMTYSMDYPTVNWLKAKDFCEGFAISSPPT
ncbi:MAG TPA: hypothetical protein VK603_11580 [Candidatus Saccharimonadales bacterium]|nr:hypothetical protein [Candidatus Saccharimonadales bacterium]